MASNHREIDGEAIEDGALNIFYQNVRGIRTKTVSVRNKILINNYDIICFSETWLNSTVFSEELFDDRYVIFRRDRESTKSLSKEGGGVLAAVSKKLIVSRKTEWESDNEDLWLVIKSRFNSLIFICILYIPPSVTVDNYCNQIEKLQDLYLKYSYSNSQFIIIGDFNLPEIKWLPDSSFKNNVLSPSNYKSMKAHSLVNFSSICNLNQFNYVLNGNENLLDLVFSDKVNINIHTAPGLTKLDQHHPSFEITVKQNKDQFLESNRSYSKYNFRKGDFDQCRQDLLSFNWISLFENKNVNCMVILFYEKLWEIIDKYFKKCVTKTKNQYPVWFNQQLIALLKIKNKVRLKVKKHGNESDYRKFSYLRKYTKKIQSECYKSYINSVESGLQGNIKVFWSYSKSLRKTNCIPKVMHLDDISANDGEHIANIFSKYFSSVYTNSESSTNDYVPSITEHNQSNLGKIHISADEIKCFLSKIDSSKGPGPDNIPPFFVSCCTDSLCLPLFIIFNASLTTGTFPDLWKKAHVVPVFKSGDQSLIKNYRPISILSCFAKVFESLIYKNIFSHFKPLLCTRQHGFVPQRSINSNLLEFCTYVCNSFNERLQVDAIYTDFQKAFDKVNHSILLKKLEQIGIHGDLLRWVKSYLYNRTQLVLINGYKSSPIVVTSGVPQGSNLGPLLFLIFINDLGSKLNCDYDFFADDLKIFRKIKSVSDHQLLQNDLDTLNNWCTVNDMHLNIEKCYILNFTRNRIIKDFSYVINNIILKKVSSIRDLGITLDSKFIFDKHINDIKCKSLKMMGFIHRICKPFKDPQSILTLYNALIRSKLEYGSTIWNPHYCKYENIVESVKKKC